MEFALIRMEGELLGYEKWKNDAFIEHIARRTEANKKWWHPAAQQHHEQAKAAAEVAKEAKAAEMLRQ